MPNKNVKEIEKSSFFATLFAEAETRDEFHVAGVKIEIAEQISRMMEKRNLTQSDLARKLGKNRAYISKILKGTTNFTIETLVLIGRKLEAELDFQLIDTERPKKRVFYMEYGSIKPPTNRALAENDFFDEIGWEPSVKWGQ